MRTLTFPIAALLLLALHAAACTTEEGTTPTCTADVNQDGNSLAEEGCNPFGFCRNSAGQVVTGVDAVTVQCCSDLSPSDTEICLYGYGEIGTVGGGTTTGSGGGGGAGGSGG